MELNGKFTVAEVTGVTKQDALRKAPFAIMGDATQAYKNWLKKQEDAVTENGKKQFYLDYLQKKSKSVAGVGYSVTIESAVEDTKQRPYKLVDVKNEQGKRKYKTIYQIINKNNGEIIGSVDTTKKEAQEYVKNLYKKGFKGSIVCKYTKQVVDGEPIAFTAEYSPSKASHLGRFVVFGVEA